MTEHAKGVVCESVEQPCSRSPPQTPPLLPAEYQLKRKTRFLLQQVINHVS